MALIANLSMFAIGARPWYEYIDTHANPSDGLSRGDFEDAEVARMVAGGKWVLLRYG